MNIRKIRRKAAPTLKLPLTPLNALVGFSGVEMPPPMLSVAFQRGLKKEPEESYSLSPILMILFSAGRFVLFCSICQDGCRVTIKYDAGLGQWPQRRPIITRAARLVEPRWRYWATSPE